MLFPDRDTATGFWRFRVEPTVRRQRQRVASRSPSSSACACSRRRRPAGAACCRPRRRRRSGSGRSTGSSRRRPTREWRHEIDRAALHASMRARPISPIGRQAIGWGRGVLFGAVDLFSPFTPLEADREWRRGVDAVRADVEARPIACRSMPCAFGDGPRPFGVRGAPARLRRQGRRRGRRRPAGARPVRRRRPVLRRSATPRCTASWPCFERRPCQARSRSPTRDR